MVAWNAPRVKVQLRLAIQRLKTLQDKKSAIAKASRREIATLIERGKLETARIKVEAIINDDIHIELLELLELYSEIILTRFGLIESVNGRQPDPGVNESLVGIVYAALRTEVKELHYVREAMMHRYGREWSIAVIDNVDNRVSPRILSKLVTDTPDPKLVNAYLGTIAEGYGVDWYPPEYLDEPEEAPPSLSADEFVEAPTEKNNTTSDSDEEGDEGVAGSRAKAVITLTSKKGELSGDKSVDAAAGSTGLRGGKLVPRPILRAASPDSTSSLRPGVNSFATAGGSGKPPPYHGVGASLTKPGGGGNSGNEPDDDDNDDLMRRFAALSSLK